MQKSSLVSPGGNVPVLSNLARIPLTSFVHTRAHTKCTQSAVSNTKYHLPLQGSAARKGELATHLFLSSRQTVCGVWIKSKCCYLNMGLSYKLNIGCFASHLAIKSPSRKNVCSETQTVGKSGYPENQLGTTCPGILLSEEGTGELGQGEGPIALTRLPRCSLLPSKGPLGCFWCPPPSLHSTPSPQQASVLKVHEDIPNTKDLPRPVLLSGVQKTDAWQVPAAEERGQRWSGIAVHTLMIPYFPFLFLKGSRKQYRAT